jgi:hypothetical protein
MSEKNTKVAPSPVGTQAMVNEMSGVMAPQPEVVKEAVKSKMIEVDSEVLAAITARLKDLETKAGEFEQTASQDQIRKIEALRASGKLIKSVKVRHFNERLVLGWATTEDSIWVADGKLHEVQKCDIFFETGDKENMSLAQFTRGTTYKAYEVLKEARTQSGDVELTLITEDGKNIVILDKYVN